MSEVKFLVWMQHNDTDHRLTCPTNPVYDPPSRPRLVCSIQVTAEDGSTAVADIPLHDLLEQVNNLVMGAAFIGR